MYQLLHSMNSKNILLNDFPIALTTISIVQTSILRPMIGRFFPQRKTSGEFIGHAFNVVLPVSRILRCFTVCSLNSKAWRVIIAHRILHLAPYEVICEIIIMNYVMRTSNIMYVLNTITKKWWFHNDKLNTTKHVWFFSKNNRFNLIISQVLVA